MDDKEKSTIDIINERRRAALVEALGRSVKISRAVRRPVPTWTQEKLNEISTPPLEGVTSIDATVAEKHIQTDVSPSHDSSESEESAA